MKKTNKEQQIIDILEAQAHERGIDIVDVTVAGTAKMPLVCVRIDRMPEDEGANGHAPTLTLDEVTEQNGWISELIEDLDPFAGSYVLEVSSPGVDRPLRRPADFVRVFEAAPANDPAKVQLSLLKPVEGTNRRKVTGFLTQATAQEAEITCEDKTVFSFGYDEIDKALSLGRLDFNKKEN